MPTGVLHSLRDRGVGIEAKSLRLSVRSSAIQGADTVQEAGAVEGARMVRGRVDGIDDEKGKHSLAHPPRVLQGHGLAILLLVHVDGRVLHPHTSHSSRALDSPGRGVCVWSVLSTEGMCVLVSAPYSRHMCVYLCWVSAQGRGVCSVPSL